MRLLVTGFPPFPGQPVNPSEELVQALATTPLSFSGLELFAERLPVEYAGVERTVDELLERIDPDLWLAFGVGRQSSPLRIERQGANRDHADRPDNAGEVRLNQPIEPDGPVFRQVAGPLEDLAAFLTDQGIRADLSEDAGTYICNHLIYHATRVLSEQSHRCKFVFIHLAPPELALPVEKLLLALQNMVGWFQNRQNTPGENN